MICGDKIKLADEACDDGDNDDDDGCSATCLIEDRWTISIETDDESGLDFTTH